MLCIFGVVIPEIKLFPILIPRARSVRPRLVVQEALIKALECRRFASLLRLIADCFPKVTEVWVGFVMDLRGLNSPCLMRLFFLLISFVFVCFLIPVGGYLKMEVLQRAHYPFCSHQKPCFLTFVVGKSAFLGDTSKSPAVHENRPGKALRKSIPSAHPISKLDPSRYVSIHIQHAR